MLLIMKKLLALFALVSIVTTTATAQNTSKNNYIGDWSDNSSWTGGSAPSATGGYHTPITVNGYITRDGNLTINNGTEFTLNDTLWITGDLTINVDNFVVGADGLLIVEGNTTVNNGGDIAADGLVVFMGDLDVTFGSDVAPDDGVYVYGTASGGGLGSPNTQSDLQADNPDLYSALGTGTLPVELLSFTTIPSTQTIQLMWTTAMEENFDFFTVERAGTDLNFVAVGTLQGNGFSTSPSDYEFVDRSPLLGVNYYRLKATDFDGSYEYHKTVSVQFNTLINAHIYPNPVIDRYFSISGAATQLQVVNLIGHVVMSELIGSSTREITIPNQVKPGTYIAVLTLLDGTQKRQQLIIR